MTKRSIIDAHIHFDHYKRDEREKIMSELSLHNVEAVISVSWDFHSAQKNIALAQEFPSVFPAIGYHPEQALPEDSEVEQLLELIDMRKDDIVAIGEIGLPHYLRREQPILHREPYIELLEIFIRKAVQLEKPVTLHAVYDDAEIVCDLLEKHGCKKAHFHWFKDDLKTVERMIENEYMISVTPDILYEREIQQLVEIYPLSLIMVETDGPWAFKGPFKNQLTHPKMIHKAVGKIAEIKEKELSIVYEELFRNTVSFYLAENSGRQ